MEKTHTQKRMMMDYLKENILADEKHSKEEAIDFIFEKIYLAVLITPQYSLNLKQPPTPTSKYQHTVNPPLCQNLLLQGIIWTRNT